MPFELPPPFDIPPFPLLPLPPLLLRCERLLPPSFARREKEVEEAASNTRTKVESSSEVKYSSQMIWWSTGDRIGQLSVGPTYLINSRL